MQKTVVQLASGLTFCLLILAFLPHLSAAITSSQPVSVSVPETTITVHGYAAPSSLVSIKEGGTTKASIASDSLGAFSASITTSTGVHQLQVSYADPQGVSSQQHLEIINAQPQQNVSKEVFLSPTISFGTQSIVQKGSLIVIRGNTIPNALVSVSLDFGVQIFNVQSDTTGAYSYTLNTTTLILGNHTLTTQTQKGASLSDISRQLAFTLQTSDNPQIPDIIVQTESLPPPVPLIPVDGSTIDEDFVDVSGESVPGAQINIYENGISYGTTTSDATGKWSFRYFARASEVTLAFEACIDGRCSILSTPIRLFFNKYSGQCTQLFSMSEYRFWSVRPNQKIDLELHNLSSGNISVDWGDGRNETFSNSETSKVLSAKYEKKGLFNGNIKLVSGNCEYVRYFSVNVSEMRSSQKLYGLLAILSLAILGYYLLKHGQGNRT